MGELWKMRPDRDLQCYFRRPSAVAALSGATSTGFVLSGSWREQFDWAVVEWSRDNVYEHPWLRNLPDGDFRGLELGYVESRENCYGMDSDLYPFVDWPYLRIWASGADGVEDVYKVALRGLAEPEVGGWIPAEGTFELVSLPGAGEYVGLAWLTEHHTYQVLGGDTVESVAEAITASVNAFSPYMSATRAGGKITLRYLGVEPGSNPAVRWAEGASRTGANGNRVGAYSYATGGLTGVWDREWVRLSGGESPASWRVRVRFDGLTDVQGRSVPVERVRKLRWTYAAEQQYGRFERREFRVLVTDWVVTGARRGLRVASPESERIEDNSSRMSYTGNWVEGRGNFSGSSIRYTVNPGDSVSVTYRAAGTHDLYLGTRYTYQGATAGVIVDGGAEADHRLLIAGEDVLCRVKVGSFGPGEHTVTVRHKGALGEALYLDFVEAAYPTEVLPAGLVRERVTLATDWDTDHSLALAAERTAWILRQLGFRGRVNHYVGALVFYEMHNPEAVRAEREIVFTGNAPVNGIVRLELGTVSGGVDTVLERVVHPGASPATIAIAFAAELNRGATALGATAEDGRLTVWSRALGTEGHTYTVQAACNLPGLTIEGGGVLAGGENGTWWTDTSATPRINRACRDWSRAFLAACRAEGLDGVSAFSTELQHGDWREAAGFAQRYWLGTPVVVATPAVQTNFSPVSIAYWKEVYRDAAQFMAEAGIRPYLQFGEVQWWYFSYNPQNGPAEGMPFYDAYTKETFQARYGRPMRFILEKDTDPALYAEEAAHCAALIGEYCQAIMDYVRISYPDARFEVLYPVDVNTWAMNRVVNYAAAVWTPEKLDCLKTEGFGVTASANLDVIREALLEGWRRGFGPGKNAHLTGVGEAMLPWAEEVTMVERRGLESSVLWALDQFCLVGHRLQNWGPGGRAMVIE